MTTAGHVGSVHMHDFPGYKRSAIRYWERRRIVFNLALFPPAFFSYMLTAGIEADLGGAPVLSTDEIIGMFVVAAIGANICYSFAYVLEFLFGDDASESHWLSWGRMVAFAGGTVVSIVLAFYGGASIAMRQYGVHQ